MQSFGVSPQMQSFNVSLAPSRLDQVINPWTWNINLGGSTDTVLERRLLDDVGSYGRQIGQLGDALGVLIDLVAPEGVRNDLSQKQQDALAKALKQLELIDTLKRARELQREVGDKTATSAA
jgi:hypothetical protein